MNLQYKFGYFILTQTLVVALCLYAVGITDRQINGQTDRQTDRRTIQLLDAPGGPFRPGHKNEMHIQNLPGSHDNAENL